MKQAQKIKGISSAFFTTLLCVMLLCSMSYFSTTNTALAQGKDAAFEEEYVEELAPGEEENTPQKETGKEERTDTQDAAFASTEAAKEGAVPVESVSLRALGTAVDLVYGEKKPASELSGLGVPSGAGLEFVGLIVRRGALETLYPVESGTTTVRLADGFLVKGTSHVDLKDYLSWDGSATPTLTAHKPSAGTVTHTSTSELYDFSIVFGQKGSSATLQAQVIIHKAFLHLNEQGKLPYGSNIVYQANQEAFLKSSIRVSSHALDSTTFVDPSRLAWQLGDVFTTPTILGYKDGFLAEYPRPNETLALTWQGGASIDPRYQGLVELVPPPPSALVCSFSLHTLPHITDVLVDTEGRRLGVDPFSSAVWSQTPELLCKPLSPYQDFKLGSELKTDGSLSTVYVEPISVEKILGSYASNSLGTTSEYYACIFDTVSYDGDAPFLKSIAYEAPHTTIGSSIKGYVADTEIRVKISDISAYPLAHNSEVSGIANIELYYQNAPYPLAYSLDNKSGSAAQELEACIELPQSGNHYDLSAFLVTITDVAGNTTSMTLADYYTLNPDEPLVEAIVVDGAAPRASLSFDNNSAQNGYYYKADRTACMSVIEANLATLKYADPKRVIATITALGQSQATLITADMFTNPSGDDKTWVYYHVFATDNTYTVYLDFTDALGHRLENPITESFVIDKTPPLLLVSFNKEDAYSPFYYNTPRLASVEVLERNFDARLVGVFSSATDGYGVAYTPPHLSAWSPVGKDSHKSYVYFSEELHYNFSLSATDLAGNAAKPFSVPEFVIDMTDPKITVEHIKDTQAIGGAVVPKVSFFDANLEDYATQVEITRSSGEPAYRFNAEESLSATTKVFDYKDLEHILENDGVYTMRAHIVDKAGNASEDVRMFSVNRFGSNYIFSDKTQEMAGAFLAKPQELVVTEINVSGLLDKETQVRISGNTGVKTLDPKTDYARKASLDEAFWSNNLYTIPAKHFSEDGFYRVFFRSVDRAGNLSENTMENKNKTRDATAELAFAVDTTQPIASIFNVDDWGIYNESEIEAHIDVSDNLAYDYARVFIDGKEVARYDAKGNQTSLKEHLTIPEADHAQEIVLEVVDRAGNTTKVQKTEVFISSDLLTLLLKTPLGRWMEITPLAGLVLGLLIALALCLIFFFIIIPLKRKKKEEEEEEKLVFQTPLDFANLKESSERFTETKTTDSK